MTPSLEWADYYGATKNRPPTKLLVNALAHVRRRCKAIDIGGGALKDTRYLLDQGFEVMVVDSEPMMAQAADALASDRLRYGVCLFADFAFPSDEYDLASAMFALPFNSPAIFDDVFARIKSSLVPGGIFCGQCFGVRDSWSEKSAMTFHTRDQVEKLLSDMETIMLLEEERDDTTATGNPKHWHLFHFIARKR